jgi:hypothetical protein
LDTNNYVARKWKLGPVEGMGDLCGGGVKIISVNRDPLAAKFLQQKIPDDVLKEFFLAARDCDIFVRIKKIPERCS